MGEAYPSVFGVRSRWASLRAVVSGPPRHETAWTLLRKCSRLELGPVSAGQRADSVVSGLFWARQSAASTQLALLRWRANC